MSMRLLGRRADGQSLVPSELTAVDAHEEVGALYWLDVQSRDPHEMDELGARFGFDSAAIEDVIDIEQLPKYDDYGDHSFVVLHALISAGDRVDTHEVDCFIGQNLLVTVHSEPVVGLDWLWAAVQTHAQLAEYGPSELFAQLAEVMGRRYLEVLDEFDLRIDDLSDRALAADPDVLAEIQVLRREEATIRKVLRPQRVVIAALRSDPSDNLSSEARDILTDAYDVHNLVVESLALSRGLLTDTLDTYRGASAERQAAATTVLTVYAAIVLPLSLITSWYGMNMTNLPGGNSARGWPLVTLGMVLVAVVSWLLFVRAGIVRRPRFARARPIVRGLTVASRAPVRPFTMLWRPAEGAGSPRRHSRRRPGIPPDDPDEHE